ncbi:Protein of unknown function (DUF2971) [Alteromonadaceae bacterium 2753L.S.0a.02]|nr:Protein of unknown function (DUF2971) [Alteromonadaceae bacterium 2753L.S.0a.02]
MRLFKFRSLSNIEFVLDIIYNQRLYCASYDKLNDPFEGLFLSNLFDLSKKPVGARLLGSQAGVYNVVASAKHLDSSLLENCRVCSLTRNISDVRLWSYYGDGHTGIAIEIEVDDNEPDLHPVSYSEKLPLIDLDAIANSDISALLRKKTLHWQHEQEYRVITDRKYFCIKEKIRTIYLGSRVKSFHADILKKAVGNTTAIYHTKINPHSVEVEKHLGPQVQSLDAGNI